MIEIIPNWHPIFVHFTVALLSVSALLFVVAAFAPAGAGWKSACLTVARWNLWIGASLTIGTVLAGWHAYNTVPHDGHSHLAMLSHRNWALPTAGVFIAFAIWSFLARAKEPGKLLALCLLLATCALAVTAYKGGELVYRHGLGVLSLPESGNGGHDHHAHENGHHHSH